RRAARFREPSLWTNVLPIRHPPGGAPAAESHPEDPAMSIRTPALLLAALAIAVAPAAAQENPHAAHATTGAASAKPTGEHAEHDMAAMHAKMHPAGAAAIKPLYDSFK